MGETRQLRGRVGGGWGPSGHTGQAVDGDSRYPITGLRFSMLQKALQRQLSPSMSEITGKHKVTSNGNTVTMTISAVNINSCVSVQLICQH